MRELISHPGLQFYICKIEGSLRYSIARNAQQARHFEVSDSDFADCDALIKQEDGASEPIPTGINASAVGLNLRIVKNEGILSIDFDGKGGGFARWTFNGLKAIRADTVYAATATQTATASTTSVEIQTEPFPTIGTASQTDTPKTSEKLTQTEILSIPDTDAKETVAVPNNKRKRLDEEEESKTLARSTSSSKPWPKHLFMRGERTTPQSKGGEGVLHINLTTYEVTYTSTWGHQNKKKSLCEQVDLSDSSLRVTYQQELPGEFAPSYVCDLLTLIKLSKVHMYGEQTPAFRVETKTPRRKDFNMWGNNDGSQSKEFTYKDPSIIVDAIVYCIDHISRRSPLIHDPYAEEAFRTKFLAHHGWEYCGNSIERTIYSPVWELEYKTRREECIKYRECNWKERPRERPSTIDEMMPKKKVRHTTGKPGP